MRSWTAGVTAFGVVVRIEHDFTPTLRPDRSGGAASSRNWICCRACIGSNDRALSRLQTEPRQAGERSLQPKVRSTSAGAQPLNCQLWENPRSASSISYVSACLKLFLCQDLRALQSL